MVATFEVLEPATGTVLAEIPVDGARQVRSAVERAARAQGFWCQQSVARRAEALGQLVGALLDEIARGADGLPALIARETGKPQAEALSMEVLPLLELIRSFTARASRLLDGRTLRVRVAPHKRNRIHPEPRGVVGVIAPYNFPLAIGCGEVVLALLAGNAVVLKPSELAPLSARRFRDLCLGCGLDANLFQIVNGPASTAQALVGSGVEMIAFTGSTAAGREVGAACARVPIPFRTELGGKAAAVVCDDADLARTAQAITWGAFANGGQVCAGVARVFVQDSVADALTDNICQELSRLKQGDPLEVGTDLGYLCPPALPAEVRRVVEQTVQAGARVAYGEPSDDARVCPIVLHGAAPDSPALTDECFGPVLAILPVSDEEMACVSASSGPGDLAAYVFSEDSERAARIAEKLRAGTVMVNDVVWSYGMPEAPWAAVSRSGSGVSHGDRGLLSYCVEKHIVGERARVLTREPFWYPYTRGRTDQMRRGLFALYGRDFKEKARSIFGL